MLTATLRQGPDRHVAHGHPWVFRRAIAGLSGAGERGAVVDVLDSSRRWIGRGLFHPGAEPAIRVLTRREDEDVDAALVSRRVDAAAAFRRQWLAGVEGPGTDAYRLIYSEADGLSGLVVDRYADALSLQVRAGAWEPHLDGVLRSLRRVEGVASVHVGVSPDHAEREQLVPERLAALGDTPRGVMPIRESGLSYEVDPSRAQKTGFYLDQRENRRRVAAWAHGRRVLSAYCYTGAFELHCARAGARAITAIDASQEALEQARRHHELNGTTTPLDYRRGDVPSALRALRDRGAEFDLIVLDPPRFVATQGQKARGLRAYKDINLLALKLLSADGILATFSCSGLVSEQDFSVAVQWAAQDSGRIVRVVETLGQPPDHPVLAGFPEGRYLKGLIVHVE